MSERITFTFGAADAKGKRLIAAMLGGATVAQDTIDPGDLDAVRRLLRAAVRDRPGALSDNISGAYDDYTRALRKLPKTEPAATQDAAADDTPARTPASVAVADVEPEEVRWLWPQRIAIGKLTLLVGDPGLGKSFLSLDLAARVSLGSRWPDCAEHAPLGSVVLLSAEDDIADTIRPRLDAAGADCTRIHVLRAVAGRDNAGSYERMFDLERDLDVLEQLLDRLTDCRLVSIDPISCYCGTVDSHRNTEVRAVLAPLADLAARRGIAVLAVTHLRKSEGSAVHRAMGSLAFIAAARAAWCVTRDKRDDKRRLFLPLKNNLGNDQSDLAFRFAAVSGHTVPALEWYAEPVTTTADEALEPERKPRGRPAEERGDAEQYLREALANGPRLARDVEDEAQHAHYISAGTLKRARQNIGIIAWRPVNPGPWWWRLPDGAQGHNGAPAPYTQELCTSALVPNSPKETADFGGQESTSAQSLEVGNGHDPDAVSRLFDEAGEDGDWDG